MLNPPVLIEGVRLRLKRALPDDAAALFALVDNAEVMRFMDWPRAASEAETRLHLEDVARRWDAGTEHQYLIVAKACGAAVGSLSFRPHGHAVDFGYLMGRTFWGQGLGSEAASLLVGWLRRQASVIRIWATCDADNTRSAAVLAGAGLQFEGRMRRATLRPNIGPPGQANPRDTLLYAWVREETPA
ncbi:MAG: GNAT family N-acetyltransferase [Rubrivivax sp.]|nr:GNAT family N-acetyltransferase [Rubrivivax sp.]MDP3615663.1 GNAT family N-acetyltransferase [Rubrivivax sp.]